MQSNPAEWESFFVAGAGATAALTGLLFVAISINLERILSFPALPGRAAEALVILGNALIVSMLGLVPGQDSEVLGVEIAALAVLAIAIPLRLQLTARAADADLRAHPEWMWSRVVAVLLATVPFLIAGLTLIAGTGGGLYWLVPGVCFALIIGVANGWVLLIEILR